MEALVRKYRVSRIGAGCISESVRCSTNRGLGRASVLPLHGAVAWCTLLRTRASRTGVRFPSSLRGRGQEVRMLSKSPCKTVSILPSVSAITRSAGTGASGDTGG